VVSQLSRNIRTSMPGKEVTGRKGQGIRQTSAEKFPWSAITPRYLDGEVLENQSGGGNNATLFHNCERSSDQYMDFHGSRYVPGWRGDFAEKSWVLLVMKYCRRLAKSGQDKFLNIEPCSPASNLWFCEWLLRPASDALLCALY
jgi:hypothetical protein